MHAVASHPRARTCKLADAQVVHHAAEGTLSFHYTKHLSFNAVEKCSERKVEEVQEICTKEKGYLIIQ